MAIKVPQSSFSKGELDPVLHERTTLASYKNGLRVARNVIVGRTGSLISRPGRRQVVQTKTDNSKVVIYAPPASGYMLEWGALYVRVYTLGGALMFDVAHDFLETDVPFIHFETTGNFVYIFRSGKKTKKFNYITGAFTAEADVFGTPIAGTGGTAIEVGGPTGYLIQYQATYVVNGEESLPRDINPGGINLPIAAGQSVNLTLTVSDPAINGVTETRYYRRPEAGGAFGYIGSSSTLGISGTALVGSFVDVGGGADYSQSPPSVLSFTADSTGSSPINWLSKTGLVYQQRLLIGTVFDPEAIAASRTGFKNNFFRDYPLAADSALKFKAGSSGISNILRMIESDGLVVFCTNGVFRNFGSLNVSNLALDKKGKWVINELIPPLAVPGGVLFVDSVTNTVRNLVFSNELQTYNGDDLSVYSNHLFVHRAVTSWGFQEGRLPVLWVTYDDGTFASFTYQADQEMKAWTRHDSGVFVESVAGTGFPELTAFVVKKGTKRYIEMTLPRYTPISVSSIDLESDMNASIAFMDSIKSYRNFLNDLIPSVATFTVTPVLEDIWDGDLVLTNGGFNILPSPGAGAVGTILRFFDSDMSVYDLEVISRVSDHEVVVRPSVEIPEEYRNGGLRLYVTYTTLTGLDHLEGESVSVIVDGGLVASPYNDVEDLDEVTVVGGQIVLSQPGALVHVGRPVIGDIETLDVDTVEQAPTVIESMTCNKLYIKVNNSIGLFASNRFAKEDKVAGMQTMDDYIVDYEADIPIVGNTYKKPSTKRVEIMPPGDWNSAGRIAIRQPDPYHFELLSIIPDLDVERRSDR